HVLGHVDHATGDQQERRPRRGHELAVVRTDRPRRIENAIPGVPGSFVPPLPPAVTPRPAHLVHTGTPTLDALTLAHLHRTRATVGLLLLRQHLVEALVLGDLAILVQQLPLGLLVPHPLPKRLHRLRLGRGIRRGHFRLACLRCRLLLTGLGELVELACGYRCGTHRVPVAWLVHYRHCSSSIFALLTAAISASMRLQISCSSTANSRSHVPGSM